MIELNRAAPDTFGRQLVVSSPVTTTAGNVSRKSRVIRVLCLSVVPSPYQRDFFRALASLPEIQFQVCYQESDCAGYPWPQEALEPWESVLPVKRIDNGRLRVHLNYRLPDFQNFDVVIVNCYLTGLTTQWLMRYGLRRSRWFFWGERLRQQSSRWRQWAQRLLSSPLHRATALAAIGNLATADYQRRFPNKPVCNIPYHCDLSGFLCHDRAPEHRTDITFLFCGIINQRKGVDLLIRAFDRLVRSGAAVRLALIGQEGELNQFLTGIKAETKARICYYGFQAPDALPHFFSKADVFVLPSRHDGWGVVVNQALGAGLPLICSTAVGAAHDLISPEENGLRFTTGSESELFSCLQRLANRPSLCRDWGKRSRDKAGDWSPAAGAKKWLQAVQTILTKST